MNAHSLASATLIAACAVAATAPAMDQCSSSKAAKVVAHAGAKDIVTTAVEAGNFKTLATALTEAKLVGALQGKGPFTVFAPTDEAFANLPDGTLATLLKPENKGLLTSILTYHVVAGDVRARDVVKLDFAQTLNGQRIDIRVEEGTVMIDGAKVTTTDIECSNGVIHVIDSVILPSSNDIIDTAVEAGSFGTLAAAIRAAGLVEALKGKGPFTVFAPTDEAFAKLPEGTVQSLLKPENKERLQAILKYHVVPGRIFSDQAAKAGMAKTLQGTSLKFRAAGDRLQVGAAHVSMADVEATNGVIHVIDSVLLPE